MHQNDAFFDFSQNPKLPCGRTGTGHQYRDRPDFGLGKRLWFLTCLIQTILKTIGSFRLLNGISFLVDKVKKDGKVVKCPVQDNYHFVSADPKHGTIQLPKVSEVKWIPPISGG